MSNQAAMPRSWSGGPSLWSKYKTGKIFNQNQHTVPRISETLYIVERRKAAVL
jgi:hypothetical protein